MRDLSANIVADLNAEVAEEVYLALLTIDHDELSEPIRVVNNIEAITSRELEFIALPFELELPAEQSDGLGVAQIKVDNVDRRIVQAIRSISSAPSVTIEMIVADDPDVVELTVDDLVLANATYDATTVRGTLQFEDLLSEPANESITPERFPSLF